MDKKKTQIYLSAILAAIAVVAITTSVVGLQQSDAGIIKQREMHVTAEISDEPIVVSAGKSVNIPVKIVGEKSKKIDVEVGVAGEGYESHFAITGEQILPKGISTTLDKNSVNLSASAEQGFVQRDVSNLRITVASDTEKGDYPLTFLIMQPNDDGSKTQVREYFTLRVQ